MSELLGSTEVEAFSRCHPSDNLAQDIEPHFEETVDFLGRCSCGKFASK